MLPAIVLYSYNDLNRRPLFQPLDQTILCRALMPMLERTAACLDPCTLQRVLPPAKPPFKSRRRLPVGFWQHGALDNDLSGVWQTLIREPLESLNTSASSQSQMQSGSQSCHTSTEPLAASSSSFLLEFLYPQGAASLLRKLSPTALDRLERPRLNFSGPGSRLFSSAAQSQRSLSAEYGTTIEDSEELSYAQDEDSFVLDEEAAEDEESFAENGLDQEPEDNAQDEASEIQPDETQSIQNGAVEASQKVRRQYPTPRTTGLTRRELEARRKEMVLGKLHDLLQRNRRRDFDEIWRAFHARALSLRDRDDHRDQFLNYVTRYRKLDQLLVQAIDLKHWETLWAVWGRYPEAQGDTERPLRLRDFKHTRALDLMIQALKSIIIRSQQAENRSRTVSQANPELSKTLLKNVVIPTIRRYVLRSRPEQYIPLLKVLKDPLVYEEFLEHNIAAREKEAVHELYGLYRRLPDVKIRGHIMRKMIERFYVPENNAVGMEMVLEDFYGRFGRLDIPAYRKYMTFYSRRGDLHAVKRFWDEYTTHYAEERKREIAKHRPNTMKDHSNPDFVPLLHVYAIRGEIEEAREVFSEAQRTYGPKLNGLCWNILLNAHAKAGEYDAAVRVFGALMQAIEPDKWSFGTIMGMSGSRGDLEFTLELYRMAKNRGLVPTPTMVDCVVEAYCQNDKFNDAESIVRMTTQKERFPKKDLVVLWNTLLYHHAARRDLTTVNRHLNEMTEHDIQYNSETYSILLRGLALCRQPHHALYLIQQAVKAHSFRPTLEHYSLLMSAFIQSGQPRELLRTSTILRDLGMPQTASILYRVLQALRSWARTPPGGSEEETRKYLVSALRQFRQSIEWGQKPQKSTLQRKVHEQPWIEQTPDLNSVSMRTQQASLLIFTFAQMRNVAEVPQILELWRSSSPETSNMPEPPIRLLQALMYAAYQDGKYDEVREAWKVVFDRAVQMSRVAAPGAVLDQPLPSTRYMLNTPLKTMQQMLATLGDAEGLRETVTSVLRAGFRLDSKNWNCYVQHLAGMKKWREAFVMCEEQLMPFWRGWRSVRASLTGVARDLPLHVRRRGTDPHMPRPISYTITVLAKAWMDLEQMCAWSSEAERLQAYIKQKASSTVAAVQMQIRSNNPYEQKIMMGLSVEEATREIEEQKKARRERMAPAGALSEGLNDMPAAFHEMMMSAQAQAEAKAGKVPEQGWDQDDWTLEAEEEVDHGSATPDGQEQSEDGDWSDVEEEQQQESDIWTPMTYEPDRAGRSESRMSTGPDAASDE